MSSRRTRRLSHIDEDTELDRLREQVKKLMIDNQALRAFISEQGYTGVPASAVTSGNDAVANIVTKEKKSRRDSTTAVHPEKSCSCKGNCSTRQCGCMKRNTRCTEFCRCGHDLCQNSEPAKDNDDDDDDKENLNSQLATVSIKVEAPTEPEDDFNPMVPRRQLSRTPIKGQNQSDNQGFPNSA